MSETLERQIFAINKRENLIGKYLGGDIFEFIIVEDGRRFRYESIAIETSPSTGIYLIDDPSRNYVLVDGSLLYYEE